MSQVNFHNVDCQTFMRNKPDKHFALAICDPPYGIGDDLLTSGGTWASKYKAGDAKWDIAPDMEYFNELFRISQNQIIWGGNYFNLGSTRGYIIWDKKTHMPTMADCEFAWTSFDRNAKIVKQLRSGNQTGEDRIHICQKPIDLYRWLLQNYAKPGDNILDTHGGSMSSAIACHMEGYDLDICEIDKEYFDAGLKRFNNYKSQLTLF